VTAGNWPHRLACITAVATVGLIVAGGLVTNTGAALAVPDWPTTFGENMLLYPWSRLAGGALIEHSHRVIAAGVGLLTVGLGVTLGLADGRRVVRWLGGVAVLLVVVQGLVGGLRVVLLRDTLAILHGALAQAFFALLVTLAVVTGPAWRAPVPPEAGKSGRVALLAVLGVAVLYGQALLGALTAHGGWLWWHVGGAAAVVAVVALLAGGVRRHGRGDGVLRRWARALEALLALQLVLGLGAYAARFTDLGLPGGQAAVIGLPVAHRAVGALLLGSGVALALHVGRRRPGVGQAVAALDGRVLSTEAA
jgi:cytochrome c oxidase assembly protein subunit 15